jgi:hypothetical protein
MPVSGEISGITVIEKAQESVSLFNKRTVKTRHVASQRKLFPALLGGPQSATVVHPAILDNQPPTTKPAKPT